MESSNDDDSKSSIKSGIMQVGLDTNNRGLNNGQTTMTAMKNNDEAKQVTNLAEESSQNDKESRTTDSSKQTTMKSNNENDQPKHPTSREWVKTNDDDKRKKWWKDFCAEVRRAANEAVYEERGNTKNRSYKLRNDWPLSTDALITKDGDLLEAAGADYNFWSTQDGDYDAQEDRNGSISDKDNAEAILTKRLGANLCDDLGEEKIKWDDYKSGSLKEYMLRMREILNASTEMPKVRHRHKFLGFGNDQKSKTDGRWLMDFIDKNKTQEVFLKKWGEIGNDDNERTEYLIKRAKPEKRKELAKLLKYKGNLKDLFRDENTATPPPVAATPQPQTGVPPTVTTPPSVEKIKLYPETCKEWKKTLDWGDRFSDWLNRKWFRFRFKNEIYNDEAGYKAAYRNYCHRDWDTGRDAGGINR